MNYFGFTAPPMSQTGAGYASNPMSSGTVGMGTLSGMSNPLMQMAANSAYTQPQAQGTPQANPQSNLLPQMLAMQQMQQLGQPSRAPQSALGAMAQATPMIGLMGQNPNMMQGLQKLGGLMGGL